MWCPEGFASLAEISEHFQEAAERWVDANRTIEHDPKADEWLDFNVDPAWDCKVAYRAWLMSRFLDEEESRLYATLPNGTPVKLALSVVRRHHFYGGDFPSDRDGWKALTEHLRDPFVFIEEPFYIINLGRIDDWSEQEDWGSALLALKATNLCPVCWKLPSGSSVSALSRYTTSSNPDRPKGGRPEKIGAVAAAYRAKFPDGHGTMVRKRVAALIASETGLSFGLDTLDRAIKLVNLPQ